jgi:hypothetical protein
VSPGEQLIAALVVGGIVGFIITLIALLAVS